MGHRERRGCPICDLSASRAAAPGRSPAGGVTAQRPLSAEPSDDGLLVSPSRAALHRAAAASGTAPADDACVSDCIEVPLPGV